MNKVKIGCCGFAGSLASYAELFTTVEVQQTFYEPPQLATMARWRREVPAHFEFTLKAWQLITHESKSPTYRRLKRELSETERTECGAFRNTKIVREAWHRTLESARVLDATRILFQCPASFKPTEANLDRMRQFFAEIDRQSLVLYWEPRGKDWTKAICAQICSELDILHAVDPFVSATVNPEDTYYRLHGKDGWRYVYTDDDLGKLLEMTPRSTASYVFFNNIKMRQDAVRFGELINAT